VDAELGHDVLGVRLGGSPGYPEAPGNVVAGEAFGNQLASPTVDQDPQ